MRKLKLKKLNVLLILFICLIIYSSINIFIWYIDNKKSKKIVNTINEKVEIKETEDSTNTKIITNEEIDIPLDNPYWDYIKMSLIDIDFTELKNINNNTIGWIQVKGTNINYPFVQAMDNEYYLTHSFDNSTNAGGWLFLDYRNNNDLMDKNSIIYAHNRKDRSMFGSLKDTLNKNWFNNSNNHIIKLSTESTNSLWQIFSIYHLPTTNDYMKISFATDDDFLNFTNMITERSVYNFNTPIASNDKILTLSTCYKTTDKLVVHAKLIKFETKE